MPNVGLSTEEASAKIKHWQETEKDFLKQTGLKKQSGRSQVGNYGRSDAAKTAWGNRKEIEKYSKIHYNKDGTVVVTDNWADKEKISIPSSYKPNAVVDTVSGKNKQRDRTIYDENGKILKQVHGGNHNNPKTHPYGLYGEHVHDFTWIDNGRRAEKTSRNLTDDEYIKHKDLLEADKNEHKKV